jgi:hypothetical protein
LSDKTKYALNDWCKNLRDNTLTMELILNMPWGGLLKISKCVNPETFEEKKSKE